ncbi:MAG: hypothetical protein ACOX5S_01485 [Patescibacteria group bacterium]|jgi:branched-subunit amino acid transport protein
MFKNLLDYSYKRSFKEAIGFYISYLVLTLILAVLLTSVLGPTSGQENFDFGYRVWNLVAIIVTVTLSFLILKKKEFLGNFFYFILALLSGVLSYFGGGLLGLIPVAFLSTR